jgi:hypothetical protein
MVLLGAGFLLAALLMLYVGTENAAGVALALTSFLLANSALAFDLSG